VYGYQTPNVHAKPYWKRCSEQIMKQIWDGNMPWILMKEFVQMRVEFSAVYDESSN
jgi:hypothetical protein